MAAPPETGSLQEALCILVHRYRMEQTFYRDLALFHQAGGSGREEAYEKYRHASFPYIERTSNDNRDRIRSVLEKAFLSGPIRVRKAGAEEE